MDFTISESLASGLPIVIINPIPGQEVENAEFLGEGWSCCMDKKTEKPDEVVSDLLSNPKQIEHMKIRSKLMAKRYSTRNILKNY